MYVAIHCCVCTVEYLLIAKLHPFIFLPDSGVCSNCQVKLPPNVLTKEQMAKLCTFITEQLEQETKLLSSSQTDRKHFTASQIHSLRKLINNKGPFDYIIDGLNVAYGGNSKFNFNKVHT